MGSLDYDRDVVFTWNGTTSGVRVPSGDVIPAGRKGLTDLRRDLGGLRAGAAVGQVGCGDLLLAEGHGRGGGAWGAGPEPPRRRAAGVVCPDRPLPKIFRLTSKGKLVEGIFEGETINTPSMLCVEDWIASMEWGRSIGGLPALIARAEAKRGRCGRSARGGTGSRTSRRTPDLVEHLGVPEVHRSADRGRGGFAKAVAKRLEAAGAAWDVGAYRDAPPGLRIWCGSTVELADVEAMLPWLDWAFHEEIARARRRREAQSGGLKPALPHPDLRRAGFSPPPSQT
jgi:phosphoserine aminotransferase